MLEVVVVDKTPKDRSELDYPILMKATDSDMVVFFTSESEGVVMVRSMGWDVGEFSSEWEAATNLAEWVEFKGHIVLENK